MDAPAQPELEGLTAILNEVRKELLDLGLRNPLLNYRLLKSRGLEIVDERPGDIYRLLVVEGRRLSFLQSDSREEDYSQRFDEVTNGTEADFVPDDSEKRLTDTYLQTSLSSKQLQTRLLTTYYSARSSIEEQGVNTLFLALGMLDWRESESSEEAHRAPLILIPVELERSNARERFYLKYTGEELGGNVSLAEFLRQSFGINFPELPDMEDLDVGAYFRAVGKAISGQPTWSIDEDFVALGFFSFSKFLMYRDLDPSTWPDGTTLIGQDLLNNLLGTGTLAGNGSKYGELDFVDNHTSEKDMLQVVDADSSQTNALLDIADGHSLVIQGPPGTGKSQTIVNAIAGAIATGKRVLFVAEKMAALDVVARRMKAAGLGAACLELHSNKANKKAVIEELRRTAQMREPQVPRIESDLAALEDTRIRLNAYCHQVNSPVGNSTETPCSLYGQLLPIQERLNHIAAPHLSIPGSGEWTEVDLLRKRASVATLQERVSRCGVPINHPFWGSQLRVFLPTQRERVRQFLLRASASAKDLIRAGQEVATLCGCSPPISRADSMLALRTALQILAAPIAEIGNTHASEWTTRTEEISVAINEGQRLREIRSLWTPLLRSDAWTKDVTVLRQTLAETGPHWWRFLSGRWRSARNEVSALMTNSRPTDVAGMIQVADTILDAARIEALHDSMAPTLSALFGDSYIGEKSNWNVLRAQLEWMVVAVERISNGELAPWCLDALRQSSERVVLSEKTSALELAIKNETRVADEFLEILEYDGTSPVETQALADLAENRNALASRVAELDSLVGYNQAAADCRSELLDSVVHIANTWDSAGSHLADLFNYVYFSGLLEQAFQERPALAQFDGIQHSQAVDRFRKLDARGLALNRLIIALRHSRRVPTSDTSNGQIGVLRHEFEKKGRFLPLRKLMAKAGNAIQGIKPVFMMSPLSIANFIPPGSLEFDLVIFDEASQVKPADALGAIARGRQTVVVGDSKQLPPTSFFDTLVAQEIESDEDDLATSDIESILGLFCSRGAHQRMLRWHYRSRHESLITVSNHLFYDDRLIVFPSPDRERYQLGLVYRHLENAPYDRSRTRTNPEEARAVAVAVINHAREQLRKPEGERFSLGVAAFSMAQMDAILAHVEALRRQNPTCEEFFASQTHEPFFVKNLENVQGDERDVIFISVGYGRTAEGYLSMSFGPLNRSGGERRLNVLITRAKQRCEVFTTLSADDLDLNRTTSSGVLALKTFLSFAATGKIDIPLPSDKPQDSVFEEQVLHALRQKGYTVHPQVGCVGFFLDLAVVDDERPGRYLIGIECDGAAYHNARSARDRDRLRQAVLEGLNWEIHRIWSTDWFRTPERELNKLIEVIERAKERPFHPRDMHRAASDLPSKFSGNDPHEARTSTNTGARTINSSSKYQTADLHINLGSTELHLVDLRQLSQWLKDVVAVESPIFWLEAVRRVASAAGVQRLGSRIQDSFQRACQVGSRSGQFLIRDGFLWRTDAIEAMVRDRSDLPPSAKKIEHVAPEEIRVAVEHLVKESYGIAPDDVASGTCRLLGFGRATDEICSVIDRERDVLIANGRLVVRGGSLVCTERTTVD